MILIAISSTALFAQEVDTTENYNYQEEEASTELTHTSVEPDKMQNTQQYKSEKIAIRKFDSKKWREIIGTTSFDEQQPAEPKAKRKDTAASTPWNSEVLRVVSYVFITAVIIFLLYLVMTNVSIRDFKIKKGELKANDVDAPLENIEDLNIHDLLQQSIREGNFRLAVRLYYLDLLKKLNETGIITWKKDKTNRDYLTEIFLKNYHFDDVKKLTLAYEQVWYGEHILNSEVFQRLANNFETINQDIINTSKVL